MKKEAHKSSASGISEKAGVEYKKESDVVTFKTNSKVSSSTDPYPPTTMKVARNPKAGATYSVRFDLNITKFVREETHKKINRKISGKIIDTVSTKND